jgi:sugar transferase (PEP-CTERM/EpsH1 system associated)
MMHAADRLELPMADAPLVVHIVHRLGVGGLENGLVNLVNHMQASDFRHAIVALTKCTDFSSRIRRSGVDLFALDKRPGQDFGAYVRLWRLLRQLRPAVVHTRNLATIDCQLVALLAGVPARVHSEHGWDVYDLHGTRWRYRLLRRVVAALTHRFVAMSEDLARWLQRDVGVPREQVRQIYSGVDAERFRPRAVPRAGFGPPGFADDRSLIVGTAGRLEPVKDPLTLLRAFARLRELRPDLAPVLRLVFVGDGSLLPALREAARERGIDPVCWFAGQRDEVPELLAGFDVFVLPSLNEGISNTILEAMATALPVVATRVGGSAELVQTGLTGALCPPQDPDAMANELLRYAEDAGLRRAHGAAAREAVCRRFTLARMVDEYRGVYRDALDAGRGARRQGR